MCVFVSARSSPIVVLESCCLPYCLACCFPGCLTLTCRGACGGWFVDITGTRVQKRGIPLKVNGFDNPIIGELNRAVVQLLRAMLEGCVWLCDSCCIGLFTCRWKPLTDVLALSLWPLMFT